MPCLPIAAGKVQTLESPVDYRETILALIAQAKKRILIAALYLQDDDAGREILAALYAARHPEQVLSVALLDNAGVTSPRKSEMFAMIERGEPNPLVVRRAEDFDALMRFVDVLLAVPSLLLSLTIIILLGFGILQVGLSLKSHDPSQRANGMLTVAGGIVITFTKEILTLITG